MKTTRLSIAVSLIMLSALSVFGQTQQGRVRTTGRPDNKEGKPISGVEIRFRGKHNAVVSNKKGAFSVDLGGGETSYIINSVNREGYELQEKELLGRKEPVSENIYKEIVMVSLKEKRLIEEKVRKQVENKYQTKLDKLQEELKEKSITEEQYKAEIKRLNDEYELRDRLIHDMVERYASSDYARMSAKEVEINTYIENGELEKADSVINSLNISKLERDRESLIRDISIKEQQIAAERRSISSIDSTLWIAYRAKADIFFADFQIDSSIYYREKLLSIDSTDISQMVILGNLYSQYKSEQQKALYYLNRARKLLGEDDRSLLMVSCLNNIGTCWLTFGKNDTAKIVLEKALEIAKTEEYKENMALVLNNLAILYNALGDRKNQKRCLDESLALYLDLYGGKNEHIITAYNNIASFYHTTAEYRKSIEYCNKGLNVMPISNLNSDRIASCYSGLGNSYHSLGMLDSAEYWYNKAKNLFVKVYGENHPRVAVCFGNLSSIYQDRGDLKKALQYRIRSLEIDKAVYVDYHNAIAEDLTNLSAIYGEMEKADSAFMYAAQAERIFLALDSAHPLLLYVYSTMGSTNTAMGNLKGALGYFIKAEQISKMYPGENRLGVASLYQEIGYLFSMAKMNEKALAYFEESVKVLDEMYSTDNYHYLVVLHNIGKIYTDMKNRDKSFEYLDRIERILERANLTETYKAAELYASIGVSHYKFKEYDTALTYLYRADRIYRKHVSQSDLKYSLMMNYFMKVYEKSQQYDSALFYAYRQLEILQLNKVDTAFENWFIHASIYRYLNLSGKRAESARFVADKAFMLNVEPSSPLAAQGLSGRYYIMEVSGWNVTETTAENIDNALIVAPKSDPMLIYRDGTFTTVTISDTNYDICVRIIGSTLKDEIVKAYNNR